MSGAEGLIIKLLLLLLLLNINKKISFHGVGGVGGSEAGRGLCLDRLN